MQELESMKACVICGEASRYAYSTNGFDIYLCSICQHLFVQPPPNDSALSEFYREFYLQDSEEIMNWFDVLARTNADLISGSCGTTKIRLLDVGSGTGSLLAEGNRRGWTCVGLEHSDQRLKITEERGAIAKPLMLREAATTFGPSSFNVVTLFHVAEHFIAGAR